MAVGGGPRGLGGKVWAACPVSKGSPTTGLCQQRRRRHGREGEAVLGHGVQAGATRSGWVWALWSNASGGAGVMEA